MHVNFHMALRDSAFFCITLDSSLQVILFILVFVQSVKFSYLVFCYLPTFSICHCLNVFKKFFFCLLYSVWLCKHRSVIEVNKASRVPLKWLLPLIMILSHPDIRAVFINMITKESQKLFCSINRIVGYLTVFHSMSWAQAFPSGSESR